MRLAGAFDPIALRAVERQLFAVHGKEILAKELAQRRKHFSEPADHRIIAADRILGLHPVNDEQRHHTQQPDPDGPDKDKGQDFQNCQW